MPHTLPRRPIAVIVSALVAMPAVAAAPVPSLEYAFEETVTLAPGIAVGRTSLGERNIVPITGGTFEGKGLRGTILPGGWDWQLTRPDGCLQIKADYMIRTDDGVVINVVNEGVGCLNEPGGDAGLLRTVPVFEAPIGKYDWLNKSAFIGTLERAGTPDKPAVRIRFYRVR